MVHQVSFCLLKALIKGRNACRLKDLKHVLNVVLGKFMLSVMSKGNDVVGNVRKDFNGLVDIFIRALFLNVVFGSASRKFPKILIVRYD